ncbi:hypothetical protein K239x_38080 [Planctomycetes bacterium K23_9]|uniref:Uncharacterized protein n=1 Tax=Stieleria marina TaxID=1930275 RepID=A0A517NXH4_9BACT|nr:hypothetical protein K239x_38080 [Planctomycetes bacterium K23_9]
MQAKRSRRVWVYKSIYRSHEGWVVSESFDDFADYANCFHNDDVAAQTGGQFHGQMFIAEGFIAEAFSVRNATCVARPQTTRCDRFSR